MRKTILPNVNADGIPIVPMTAEQKYIFDLKGWIVLPGLIGEEQLGPIREHQMAFLNDRESLPPEERDNHGGASQVLLDHPVVVGVLNEIVSHQPLATEDCYGFRFDHTYTSHRPAGHDNFRPHGGGGFFNFGGDSHNYQMLPARVHAGLTRVVWELNEVGEGDGGTMFLSGSHKAAYPRPESVSGRDSHLWETYTCPPGSAVVFTEALCHSGTEWTNDHHDRISLFTCYNTVTAKWGKACPPQEVIDAMPPLRRSLFRGVWQGMNKAPDFNTYCDQENTARFE